MAKKYLTPKEYAELYRITVKRVWFWLEKGELPGAMKVGKQNWLIPNRARLKESNQIYPILRKANNRLNGIRGKMRKETEDAGEIIAEIELPPIPFELQREILSDE